VGPIKTRHCYMNMTDKTILKTALKHVTMRLMSSYQRLRGSGVGKNRTPVHGRNSIKQQTCSSVVVISKFLKCFVLC